MGPLSRRETPPALFAVDPALCVRALDVGPWIDRADSLLSENHTAEALSQLVRQLAPLNPVPPDAEAWATLNLFHTGFQSDVPISDSFVIATRPEYFALDWHELPLTALAAFIRAWQVIEEIGLRRGETPLLFANAGSPLSGRSLTDPHAQAQLCTSHPELYRTLHQNRSWFSDLLKECNEIEIDVPAAKNFALFAHPAPEFNYTLLIVAREPIECLAEADAQDVAVVLDAALKRLMRRLGEQPAYNVIVRGLDAGHLHLEVIPRSTNIKGGAEIAAGSATIDVDPEWVKEALAAGP